ncbi:MAG TPA: DUF2188 domain-containing protein [Chitinophagaceae bacterium]|nr:DUF2188 domain-containing protein [Chitinophagaceae bacterium]
MAKKTQHVVPLGNGWAVKGEGSKKFTVITERQRDAITVAREIAKSQKSEVIIHGRDGKIRDKDSYATDVRPPKDKKR